MDPEAVSRRVIVPVAALEWALTPLLVLLLGFSHLVARLRRISLHGAPTASRPEDVRFLFALARQEGHLTELQYGMLEAVLRFEGAQVRQVQVPRTDVVFLADTLTVDEVEARVRKHGYSRYPVYHERDDNVVGILLAKDLLRPEAAHTGSWTTFLQPPLFVPESKRTVELLREMREQAHAHRPHHRRVREPGRPGDARGPSGVHRRGHPGRVRHRAARCGAPRGPGRGSCGARCRWRGLPA